MPEPDTTPAAEAPTGWHYGPTATDPDPGKMWHYGCGQEVLYVDDGAVCGCGATWDENGQPEDDDHVCKPGASVYYCPTAGETESDCHGGFDTCCDQPDLHQSLIPCSLAVLHQSHDAHAWQPQPGMSPVHCVGATGRCSCGGHGITHLHADDHQPVPAQAPADESDAARLERRAAQMARALGVPETSTWLELTLAAVTATQGLKRIQARVEQAEADLATSEALVAAQRRVIQRQARDSLTATTGPRAPRQRHTPPAPDNRNGEDQ